MTRLIDADALKKRLDDEVPIRPISLTYNKEDVIRAVLDAPTVGSWISVKDRLPEPGRYLCLDSEKRVVIGSYKDSEHNKGWFSMNIFLPPITHWMPLPSTEGIE